MQAVRPKAEQFQAVAARPEATAAEHSGQLRSELARAGHLQGNAEPRPARVDPSLPGEVRPASDRDALRALQRSHHSVGDHSGLESNCDHPVRSGRNRVQDRTGHL